MTRVILPPPLAARIGNEREVTIEAAAVGPLLAALEQEHPQLRGWVLDDRGRIREHVNVFVNSRQAGIDDSVDAGDEVFIMQAISGGEAKDEILIGTKKGLFVLRGARGDQPSLLDRRFAGEVVEYACRDPRSGYYFASVTHGQFGPHVYRAQDPMGEWTQVEGPAFPGDTGASVDRVWVIEPGVEEGVLWAGVAPAALFKSTDDGATWEINRALWDEPTRPSWEGGFGGLCLHTICPWPDEPRRLTLGISSVGVWRTDDGGATWNRFSEGLVPHYLPEEARADTLMHCVHKMEQAPLEPQTFYMQFHGGVYRSDDGARTWVDIGRNGLPADFGFPIVTDPRDPDRAFVIPLVADLDRVTVDGKVRVYETTDRGATWSACSEGLPQENAYETVLRQAFCQDGRDPLGLIFGTESGNVYGSRDTGGTWSTLAERLPAVLSVRAS